MYALFSFEIRDILYVYMCFQAQWKQRMAVTEEIQKSGQFSQATVIRKLQSHTNTKTMSYAFSLRINVQ